MKLKVTGTRVLVKPFEAKKQIDGILLPQVAKKNPPKYQILDIGAQVEYYSVGQNVLLGEYAGIEVTFEKQQYRIVEESEIVAKIQE